MEQTKKIDLNILYVEDDPTVGGHIFNALCRFVKKVYYEHDGLKGLEKFKEIYHTEDVYNRIDLILTDINMPHMSGFEMLIAIREIEPDMRAIILTAYSSDEFFEIASQLDILNNYLIKPTTLPILMDKLALNEKKIAHKKEFMKLQKLHAEYEYAINEKMLVSKTDPNGNITHVNDKFCEVSGFSRDELIGQPHSIVRSPKMAQKEFKKLWETITNKEVYQGIMINKTKQGGEFVADTTVLPLIDIHGNIQEYISIRTDITSYVKTRDDELIKMQEKTIMLFTHELKSPLNSIIAFNENIMKLLGSGISDTKIKMITNFSKIIGSSAHTLLATINTLLDLAKLKSNNLKFHTETFDLVGLINSKIETYQVINKREITTFLPDSLIVNLDFKCLDHIIENLLTNALKYSFTTVLFKLTKNNDFIVLSVEDDGAGISEANRELIFDMFAQEAEGRSLQEKGGTGVGLHLVKLLCDNNNFTINVGTSQKLGGALFEIKIPITEDKNV